MCTVTYIPTSEHSFILTHNRDESVKRELASPPVQKKINGIQHIFPVDPRGMGTWVGISENNRVASLLNGGSKKYTYDPPYRQSRGLVIPEYFRHTSFEKFVKNFNFKGLEPFTLLVIENGEFYELIVNGYSYHVKHLDPHQPYIYSSVMLYGLESKLEKRRAFLSWLKTTPTVDIEDVLKMHENFLFENEKDKEKVVGKHILKTVSITSIVKNINDAEIKYLDRVNDVYLKKTLKTIISTNLLPVE